LRRDRHVRNQQRTPSGIMSSSTPFGMRRNRQNHHSPCTTFKGKGSVRRDRTITVISPAGIDEASDFRPQTGQQGDQRRAERTCLLRSNHSP
jgi:DnaJ-class molecular chaperone